MNNQQVAAVIALLCHDKRIYSTGVNSDKMPVEYILTSGLQFYTVDYSPFQYDFTNEVNAVVQTVFEVVRCITFECNGTCVSQIASLYDFAIGLITQIGETLELSNIWRKVSSEIVTYFHKEFYGKEYFANLVPSPLLEDMLK